MVKDKYRVEGASLAARLPDAYGAVHIYKATKNTREKEEELLCTFWGPDSYTNAQKVADLLNETSRSQGQWPKRT